jgi:hypothetical protein
MAFAMKGNAMRCSTSQRSANVCKAPANKLALRQLAPKARGALQIVAYREGTSVENTAHRVETVNAIGREMVEAWFQGIKEGSQAASGALEQYCGPEIVFCRNQALESDKGKGLEFLRQQLDKESSQYQLQDFRIVASAASDQDDTFFGLVEYKYTSKAAGANESCTGYKVLEIDVMMDDGARKVVSLHERGQLSPEDVPQGAAALCNSTVFPVDRLGSFPSGLEPGTVVDNVRAWCKARSSGESEDVLDGALDSSFRLYDAFGLLPSLVGSEHTAKPEAAVVPYDKVKELVKQSKSKYEVDCHLVDAAVSQDANVSFSHWRSHFTPSQGDGKKFTMEGIEVEVFGKDGKLSDIWLFRDPMDFEREMLQKQA